MEVDKFGKIMFGIFITASIIFFILAITDIFI